MSKILFVGFCLIGFAIACASGTMTWAGMIGGAALLCAVQTISSMLGDE